MSLASGDRAGVITLSTDAVAPCMRYIDNM